VADRFRAMRRSGESYSDVIMRFVKLEGDTASRCGEPLMTKDPENPNPPGKRIEVHMQEGLVIGEKKLFRHRSPGRDNYNIQHIEGDSLEENTQESGTCSGG
jgi:hypothetical protein